MSLINQMLQDLEKRQGEPESAGQLPQGVHFSPQGLPARRSQWLLLAVAGLLIVAAALYWFKFRHVAEPTPVVTVAEAPVAVPLPPPVVTPEPTPAAAPLLASAAPAVVPSARVVETSHGKSSSTKKEAKSKKAKAADRQEAGKKQQAPAKPSSKVQTVQAMPADAAQERAEASYREALAAFNQGRSAETQQAAKRALAEVPGHIGARQLLVRQLMEQRSNDQARAELKEGLQHQPAQMPWSTLLVRLELERGDPAAARKVVDRALPYAEHQADFQSLAGAVAQRQGKPEDASNFYRTALRIKPADGRSWVGLGISLEAEGHLPEAREAFRRALSTDALSPELEALAQRKSR